MSNFCEPHQFQVHGLPPRPAQSYKSPTRRRPQSKLSNLNKENQQSSFRAPRFSHQSYQPLTDASNTSTLPYHPSSIWAYQLPPEPSPFFFCSASPQSLFAPNSWTQPSRNVPANVTSVDPAFSRPVQTLRTGPLPVSRSYYLPNPSNTDSELKTTDSPKMRRKLAVEGVRKAVSDAALRKMGISQGGAPALDQPINLNVEKQTILETKVELQQESETVCPSAQISEESPRPYSPRQYTPKPLLLPSILARGHPTRSPPPLADSLISPRRKVSSPLRSRLSTLTCYHVEKRPGPISEDNSSLSASDSEPNNAGTLSQGYSTPSDHVSTTPSDSSFANDDETSTDCVIINELHCGSTTPCDSSFDQIIAMPESNGVDSPQGHAKAERIDFGATPVDGQTQSRHTVLETLMWTIAAPQKRTERCQRKNLAASDPSHRKSMGFWLGSAIPCNVTTKHNRASSETHLDHTIESSSSDDPIHMKLLPRSDSSTRRGVDFSDTPVAQPTFILPTTDTRKGVYTNLRKMASTTSLWSSFFRKPSLSFLKQT